MKITIKSLVSFFLMFAFVSFVSANTTYNVSRTVGAGSVSGFIETDGALGVLSNANIVDWQLTLTSANLDGGSPSFIKNSNPNANLFGLISGTSVSASATDIFFNFAANSDFLILYSTNDAATSDSWWCLIGGNFTCIFEPVPSETIGYGGLGTTWAETQLMPFGLQSIAQIPEPEIYAMLAAGLGLMGFVARRRKQQLAAA